MDNYKALSYPPDGGLGPQLRDVKEGPSAFKVLAETFFGPKTVYARLLDVYSRHVFEWGQGEYGATGKCFCLMGGGAKVGGFLPLSPEGTRFAFGLVRQMPREFVERTFLKFASDIPDYYRPMRMTVDSILSGQHVEGNPECEGGIYHDLVVKWNDAPERRQSDVIDLLAAADAAQAETVSAVLLA